MTNNSPNDSGAVKDDCSVVMSFFDIGMALRAVKKGIFDFTISPNDTDQLLITVDRAIQHYNHLDVTNTGALTLADDSFHREYGGEHQTVLIKKKKASNCSQGTG